MRILIFLALMGLALLSCQDDPNFAGYKVRTSSGVKITNLRAGYEPGDVVNGDTIVKRLGFQYPSECPFNADLHTKTIKLSSTEPVRHLLRWHFATTAITSFDEYDDSDSCRINGEWHKGIFITDNDTIVVYGGTITWSHPSIFTGREVTKYE